MPPMRYTNQGQGDKKDDGSRPMLPEEEERLAKELENKHNRSISESGLIHYARLQSIKQNDKDRKAAKKAAKKEALLNMRST